MYETIQAGSLLRQLIERARHGEEAVINEDSRPVGVYRSMPSNLERRIFDGQATPLLAQGYPPEAGIETLAWECREVGNWNTVPPNSFDLEEVRRIVNAGLRGYPARVYLFGSWAKGCPSRTSDIDVAVLPLTPLPESLLSEIRQTLEDSLVVYPVDLVDLSEASLGFRDRILLEGILWNG